MSQQAPVARPPRDKTTSKSRESKSVAVRAALANPSKRQLTKWQRERRQKLIILSAALGIAAIAVVVLIFGYWREMLARPNEAAAEVGDQAIPLHALAVRLRPQLMAIDNEIARVQNEVVPTSSGASGADPQSRQVQMLYSQRFSAMDQVLGDLIDDELVLREAQQRNLTVTPGEIEARIQSDLAKQKALSSPPAAAPTPVAGPAAGPTPSPTPPATLTADEFQDTYQTFLSRISYSDEQYRKYIEAQLLRDKVRDAQSGSLAPTQEHVQARRITVTSQEDATATLAQLRSGEAPFEDLARDKSQDLTSKSQGGNLGWLPRGIESTQFDEQAFRLGVGEIGDAVVTPQGWEIVQVLEKGQRPVSPEHLDRLKAKAMDQWLRTAREDPSVRRSLDKEKRDWVLRQAGDKSARRGAAPAGAPPGRVPGF